MKNIPKAKKPPGMRTMILSLILAIAVWIAVTYVNDPDITTTLSGLYVHFNGETALRERGMVITGRNEIPPASVSVSGKRKDLLEYMNEVHIEVDVSDIHEEGEYTLKGAVKLPTTRISVEKEKYGDISVNVEKLCEKEIPVKVRQPGTLKNKIVESVLGTKTVKITGSQSELDMVSYGIADVDVSEITENGESEVKYLLLDQSGGYIEKNETIEADAATIKVTNIIYDKKTLPVKLVLTEEMHKKYVLNESKSTSSVTELEVGVLPECTAEEVQLYIDRKTDSAEEFTLTQAEGMYVPENYRTVKVKPSLTEKTTAELEIRPYGENLAEGLEAEFTDIKVEVSALEDKLNADSVKAKVNLDGLGEGEHVLPVTIEGETVSVHKEYTAYVIIRQKQ